MIRCRVGNLVIILAATMAATVAPRLASGDNPYAPQPQSSLQPMLSINWSKGPDLPQGFQDSDGGIINNTLITVAGYCGGQTDVPGKPNTYPYGFLKKTWGLNLSSPQSGWQSLPDFPGAARQELFSTVVNNRLYAFGGYNYSAIYSNGYRLSQQNNGSWTWSQLPSLPWPISSSGITAIGSKIFVVGGSDYEPSTNKFYTNSDHNGNVSGLGARLMELDTDNLNAGWQQLATCPGTRRFVQATAAVNGKLYMFGGATGTDNPSGHVATVVDNWEYDPATNAWTRLHDLPVASGNFPGGSIVYDNRYVMLVGGYQYGHVLAPDSSVQPVYGTPSKASPGYDYNSDIFVYDTQTNLFGTATGLPLNNNMPMTVVNGNQIYMIGGETAGASGFDGFWLDGEAYGHHPDLYLTGTISVVPEPGMLGLAGTAALSFLMYGCWKRKQRSCYRSISD